MSAIYPELEGNGNLLAFDLELFSLGMTSPFFNEKTFLRH